LDDGNFNIRPVVLTLCATASRSCRASPAYQYEANEYRAKFYRHVSEGGWPFSTSAHGWPISDCTGEGLKGVFCLLNSQTVVDGISDESLRPIDEIRLEKAAAVLLLYQNEDGGELWIYL
jgi:hypothetical protein